MGKFRRRHLRDAYRFAGFVPMAQVRGVSGDRLARVVALRRRGSAAGWSRLPLRSRRGFSLWWRCQRGLASLAARRPPDPPSSSFRSALRLRPRRALSAAGTAPIMFPALPKGKMLRVRGLKCQEPKEQRPFAALGAPRAGKRWSETSKNVPLTFHKRLNYET